MNKRVFKTAALLAVLLLVCGICSRVRAADLSAGNCAREKLSRCDITTLLTNQYTEDRPVIIFFPGYNEANSRQKLVNFIRKYHLYDGLETDLIAVTVRGGSPWYRDWEPACRDLYEYLKDKYADAGFPIIVDAVSFGGYGGCWLTQFFQENGIPVRELNMADACSSSCITADWLRDLAAAGTRVNLWGCSGSSNISADTRNMITALEGTANIRCYILESGHGAVLSHAIHDYDLHAEYAAETGASGE